MSPERPRSGDILYVVISGDTPPCGHFEMFMPRTFSMFIAFSLSRWGGQRNDAMIIGTAPFGRRRRLEAGRVDFEVRKQSH